MCRLLKNKFKFLGIVILLSAINIKAQTLKKDSSVMGICNTYFTYSAWLPNAYISNATCACNMLLYDSTAKIIRGLLLRYLSQVDSTFIDSAKKIKNQFIIGKISKRKYKKYVKRNIVPIIYLHHVQAYRQAGCPKGPAPYWEWKLACTRKFRNCQKMFKYNVQFGGSCFGSGGAW